MYLLTLTEEQKNDMLTALLEYRDSISKFDQFSVECERLEELLKRIEEGMIKHGKWETNKVAFMKTCSLCGKSVDQSHDYNFCPECGAKMDLEGE